MRIQSRRQPTFWIVLFLLPTIVLYGLYSIYPAVMTLWYSVFDINGFSAQSTFIGLDNYRELFSDSLFWNSLKNTFLFLLYAVPGRFVISLLLALLLTWKLCPFKSFFRTLVFIPVVTTGAIIGTIMVMIFDPGNGPVNAALSLFGLETDISFLGNANTALFTSAVIWIWKWVGTSLIYWIASLQSIPDELYEAATIDGAGAWKRFRYITAPLLIPYGIVILVLTISDALRVFDLMLTLTGGGPFYRTEVMEIFIYRHAFGSSVPRIGYASAAATVFGVIFVFMTLLQSATKKLRNRG